MGTSVKSDRRRSVWENELIYQMDQARKFFSQRRGTLIYCLMFDHLSARRRAVPPTKDQSIGGIHTVSLREDGAEVFKQLFLRSDQLRLLLQRLSDALDPFCKRHKRLCKV